MPKRIPHSTPDSLNRATMHDAALEFNNFATTPEQRVERLLQIRSYYEGYCDASGWEKTEAVITFLSR